MKEGEIYYFLKKYLLDKNWVILAGEPPDGSDNIPRIEIRSKKRVGIGSKGSYKIDLLALKRGALLLIELKPKYNQGDIDKLNTIKSERIKDLLNALNERCNLKSDSIKEIIKCVGIGELCGKSVPVDFLVFLVKDEKEIELIYGENIEPLLFFKD